jgi:hypothetical protein
MNERFAKEEFRDDACVATSAFCSMFLSVTKSKMPTILSLHSSPSSSVSSPAYSEPDSGSSVKALWVGTEGVRRVVMDSEFDSSKGGEWEMLRDCAGGLGV